ncbi:MAG: cadherin repeat domain-containing protein [Puniceicoccaceae bacterium]
MFQVSIVEASDPAPNHGDVTDSIQRIGNPHVGTNLSGRARSNWDLQWFDGRLYLGAGNTTTNPGSNRVWSFSPTTGLFTNELLANTEAIENYRVIDGRLYLPAADPASGDSQKFYYRDPGGEWVSVSGGPNMAHIRDLAKVGDNQLFMVGNSRNPSTQIGLVTSTLNGGELKRPSQLSPPFFGDFGYGSDSFFYSVINYNGLTIATNGYFDFGNRFLYDFSAKGFTDKLINGIGIYDATTDSYSSLAEATVNSRDDFIETSDFLPISKPVALPGNGDEYLARFFASASVGNRLVYSLRAYSLTSYNNYYTRYYQATLGAYVKTQLQGEPIFIQFPTRLLALGEDVLELDGAFYVLATTKVANNNFIISVHRSSTPEVSSSWQELFHFNTVSRAKSFEYVNGIFYFGLGADDGENTSAAGDLLRYVYDFEPGDAGPTDITLSEDSVLEGLPIGTTVGVLATIDADPIDFFSYTISGPDAAAFSVQGPTLRTAAVFDYNTKSSYSITVRSTDSAGLYFEKSFNIQVLKVETLAHYTFEGNSLASGPTTGTAASAVSQGPGTGFSVTTTAEGRLRTTTTNNNPNGNDQKRTNGQYSTFTVTALPGHKLDFTGIETRALRGQNSPDRLTIYASGDGAAPVKVVNFVQLNTSFRSFDNLNLSDIASLQNVSEVVFQIVFSGSSTAITNGLNEIDDIKISGRVRSLQTPYQAWSATIDWGSTPEDLRAPDADANGNGYINYAERALGGNPVATGSRPETPVEIETLPDNTIRLTQWYAKGAPELTYQFKWSTDLVEWSATGVSSETFDPETGLYYQTWTAPAGTDRAFGRLAIEQE